MGTIFNTIQHRRGTAAAWLDADPILAQGELGIETDTSMLKIGNGVSHWTELHYYPQLSSTEWIQLVLSGLTYLSANQFTCTSDQTAAFPTGIRIKADVTAGTIFGSVTNAEANGTPEITTVTVEWDSGQLDAGLSDIYTGIFSPVNPSVPTMFFTQVGMIFPFGGDSAPTGYLMCYGQAVSRTTYAALFAVIGTKFGEGDGSTTFNIPDLRGRGIIGPDNMGGSAAGRVTGVTDGDSGGSESIDLEHLHTTGDHTLTIEEIPPHTHTCHATETQYGYGTALPPVTTPGITNTGSAGGGASHNHGDTGEALGDAQSIMNPYLAINCIIRYL